MSDQPNAASVALFDAESVLLIKRALPPYQDHWTLPGGRLEPGETAIDCAIREIREELGLNIVALFPVTVQMSGHWQLQVFTASAPQARIQPSREVGDWRWITPDDVSGLKTTPDLDKIIHNAWTRLNTV